MNDSLEYQPNGEIRLFPLTGWTTGSVAGTAILLRVAWTNGAEPLQPHERNVQLILTPQQALDLGDELTRHARHVLALRPQSPVK